MSDSDDPFKSPTIIRTVRPSPGGVRQPGSPGGTTHTPPSYLPADAVLPPLRDVLASGLNPLGAAATPLLVLEIVTGAIVYVAAAFVFARPIALDLIGLVRKAIGKRRG